MFAVCEGHLPEQVVKMNLHHSNRGTRKKVIARNTTGATSRKEECTDRGFIEKVARLRVKERSKRNHDARINVATKFSFSMFKGKV